MDPNEGCHPFSSSYRGFVNLLQEFTLGTLNSIGSTPSPDLSEWKQSLTQALGQLFYVVENGVSFFPVKAFVAAQQQAPKSRRSTALANFKDTKTVSFRDTSCQPLVIGANSAENLLAIVVRKISQQNGAVELAVLIYDIPLLLDLSEKLTGEFAANNEALLYHLRLDSYGRRVASLVWNPGEEEKMSLAVLMEDTQCLTLWKLTENSVCVHKTLNKVRTFSWSPKGKQFAVVREEQTDLEQFDMELQLKRRIPLAPHLHVLGQVYGLCWVRTFTFVLGCIAKSPTGDMNLVLGVLFAPSKSDARMTPILNASDMAYGEAVKALSATTATAPQPAFHFVQCWNFLLAGCTYAQEVAWLSFDPKFEQVKNYRNENDKVTIRVSADQGVLLQGLQVTPDCEEGSKKPLICRHLSDGSLRFGQLIPASHVEDQVPPVQPIVKWTEVRTAARQKSPRVVAVGRPGEWLRPAAGSGGTTTNLVSQLAPTNGFSFGGAGNTLSTPSGTLFGGAGNTTSAPANNLFGSSGNTSSTPSGTLFGGAGNTSSTPSGTLFGGAGNTTSAPGGNLFGSSGNTSSTPSGTLFGNTSSAPAGSNLFSATQAKTPASATTFAFGSGQASFPASTTSTVPSSEAPNLFGAMSAKSTAGSGFSFGGGSLPTTTGNLSMPTTNVTTTGTTPSFLENTKPNTTAPSQPFSFSGGLPSSTATSMAASRPTVSTPAASTTISTTSPSQPISFPVTSMTHSFGGAASKPQQQALPGKNEASSFSSGVNAFPSTTPSVSATSGSNMFLKASPSETTAQAFPVGVQPKPQPPTSVAAAPPNAVENSLTSSQRPVEVSPAKTVVTQQLPPQKSDADISKMQRMLLHQMLERQKLSRCKVDKLMEENNMHMREIDNESMKVVQEMNKLQPSTTKLLSDIVPQVECSATSHHHLLQYSERLRCAFTKILQLREKQRTTSTEPGTPLSNSKSSPRYPSASRGLQRLTISSSAQIVSSELSSVHLLVLQELQERVDKLDESMRHVEKDVDRRVFARQQHSNEEDTEDEKLLVTSRKRHIHNTLQKNARIIAQVQTRLEKLTTRLQKLNISTGGVSSLDVSTSSTLLDASVVSNAGSSLTATQLLAQEMKKPSLDIVSTLSTWSAKTVRKRNGVFDTILSDHKRGEMAPPCEQKAAVTPKKREVTFFISTTQAAAALSKTPPSVTISGGRATVSGGNATSPSIVTKDALSKKPSPAGPPNVTVSSGGPGLSFSKSVTSSTISGTTKIEEAMKTTPVTSSTGSGGAFSFGGGTTTTANADKNVTKTPSSFGNDGDGLAFSLTTAATSIPKITVTSSAATKIPSGTSVSTSVPSGLSASTSLVSQPSSGDSVNISTGVTAATTASGLFGNIAAMATTKSVTLGGNSATISTAGSSTSTGGLIGPATPFTSGLFGNTTSVTTTKVVSASGTTAPFASSAAESLLTTPPANINVSTATPTSGLNGNASAVSTSKSVTSNGSVPTTTAGSPGAGGGLFGATTTTAGASGAGGGLFGATTTSTGPSGSGFFTATTTTAGSSGAGAGLFGATTTTTGSGGGLFGATTTTAGPSGAGGGLFGATTATTGASGGGLFGATTATTGSGGGLFGATTTTTGSGGGLFSATTATTGASGGGLLGATTTTAGPLGAGGGLLGATTTTAGPSVAGGGLFGATTAGPSGAGGGLFGATTATTGASGGGLFGATTATTGSGGGLFGATTTTTGSGGGLFGATTTTAGPSVAGGGLFGATTTTTSSSGGGLLGATTTTAGSSGAGVGLFGATTATTGSGGGLFGATTATTGSGGGLFGATTATTGSGGGLFGVTTATTGASGGGLFGAIITTTGASGGGLFGISTTATGPSGGGLFGATTTTTGPSGGGLFGSTTTTTGSSGAGGGLFGANSASGGSSGPLSSNATGGLFSTGATAQSGSGVGAGTVAPSVVSAAANFQFNTAAISSPAVGGGLFDVKPTPPQATAASSTAGTSALFGSTNFGLGNPSPASSGQTLFGAPASQQVKTDTGGGLFGNVNKGSSTPLFGGGGTTTGPASSGGLFGNTATPSGTKGLFSGTNTPQQSGQMLFTPVAATSTGTSGGGIFSSPTSGNKSLFGNASASPSAGGSLFSGAAATATSPTFGGAPTFSGVGNLFQSPTGSGAGQGLFAAAAPAPGGGGSGGGLFSAFAQSSAPSFGSLAGAGGGGSLFPNAAASPPSTAFNNSPSFTQRRA